jgi:uncharacterized damage-inducible protein DinB
MDMLPEPWLRGPKPGVNPMTAPVLYALQQAREDLAKYTNGLTTGQIWATPYGLGPVGFHLRHIAGSTDRLLTYLEGKQLSAAQVQTLLAEKESGTSCQELLAEVEASFRRAEAVVQSLDSASLIEPRYVGRKQLPTTVIGLLTHIAEHTQRHVGQVISAANLAVATAPTGRAFQSTELS